MRVQVCLPDEFAEMNENALPVAESACASVLKVLGDDTRLAVARLLMDSPKHVGEISELLDVEQTLLSHHLRVLRDASLVTCERRGKQMFYSLAKEVQMNRQGHSIDLGCCKISFD